MSCGGSRSRIDLLVDFCVLSNLFNIGGYIKTCMKTIAVGVLGNIGKMVLEYLITRKDIKIIGVVSKTDRIGQYNPESDIDRLNLPKKTYEEIVNLKPDIYLNVSYPKIIGKELLDSSLCINLHMAKLPDYKGRNVFTHIIQNKENIAGTTLHMMVEKVDAGDIIAERQLPVSLYDTAKDLHDRMEDLSIAMLKEEFTSIVNGTFNRRKQVGIGHVYKLDLDKELNLEEDPYVIYNKIRSLDFPPYDPAYFYHAGKKIYVTLEDIDYNFLTNKIKFNESLYL